MGVETQWHCQSVGETTDQSINIAWEHVPIRVCETDDVCASALSAHRGVNDGTERLCRHMGDICTNAETVIASE